MGFALLIAMLHPTMSPLPPVFEDVERHDDTVARRPKVDRAALMALAHDLPSTWNALGTDARTKQRIAYILIREVVLDRDDATNQAIVTIHWNGGRHTELRVSRTGAGRYPADRHQARWRSSASSAVNGRIASWQ